jgi:hypothetical protein
MDEVIVNRPAMLSSTLAGGNYSWHTMVIYGYRLLSNGEVEYLVHTGWYTSLQADLNGIRYMPEIWVSSSIATYLYKFINN